MRNHLKIVSIGMIALFMLASCSTDVNDVISIGFNRAGSESVSGWVKMGIKTKKSRVLMRNLKFLWARKRVSNLGGTKTYPNPIQITGRTYRAALFPITTKKMLCAR